LLGIYVAAYAAVRLSGLVYLYDGTVSRYQITEYGVHGDLVYPTQRESPLPPGLFPPIRIVFGVAAVVEGKLRPLGLVRAPALLGWILLLWPLFVRRPSRVGGKFFLILIATSVVAAAILITAAHLEGDPTKPIPTVIYPVTGYTRVPP
jgi:hypothetical protein